ncbi:hypothetical protein M434DRAFT_401665 [Hypoxylon sp. CO27-5]|nr:hypothetical protein M434DRAFT_401665 [Hypoxylon sp. CO27-5]
MLDLLSVELIELIAHSLDDRVELLALRLVCRHLCEATSVLFARDWFTTLTIDFTPRSLIRLTNITRYEYLTLAVRCLQIADCFRPPIVRPLGVHVHDRPARVLGEGLPWPRLENGNLDLTSRLVNDFMALIARFSLCTEICVTDGLDELPQDDDDTDTKLTPLDACYIMFSLLEKHGGFQIQSFTIRLDRSLHLGGNTAQLPQGLADLLVRTSWPSHLKQLNIAWELNHELVNRTMDLISTATCLQCLRLSFPGSPLSETMLQLLSQAPRIPALTELKLSSIQWLTPNTLSGSVARFQESLKSLHIDHLNLSEGDFNTFFGLLADQNLPALESITVADCFRVFFCPLRVKADTLERCGGRFEFTLRHFRRKSRVSGVRYCGSGEGMRLTLQTLADNSSYRVGAGPSSPGLMIEYVGDLVGHVVEKFI